MSEPDCPEDEKVQAPYFPPPRRQAEETSPYRVTLPATYEPPERPRRADARASPPDHAWPRLLAPPVPLTILDRLGWLGALVRAFGVLMSNHPVACCAIVLGLLGALLSASVRQIFGGPFSG